MKRRGTVAMQNSVRVSQRLEEFEQDLLHDSRRVEKFKINCNHKKIRKSTELKADESGEILLEQLSKNRRSVGLDNQRSRNHSESVGHDLKNYGKNNDKECQISPVVSPGKTSANTSQMYIGVMEDLQLAEKAFLNEIKQEQRLGNILAPYNNDSRQVLVRNSQTQNDHIYPHGTN